MELLLSCANLMMSASDASITFVLSVFFISICELFFYDDHVIMCNIGNCIENLISAPAPHLTISQFDEVANISAKFMIIS
jgi:hypothetical protein